MAETNDHGEQETGPAEPLKPGLKARFLAWWEGEDVDAWLAAHPDQAVRAQPAGEAPPERHDPATAPPPARIQVSADAQGRERTGKSGKPLWNAERIEVAETLWGENFICPGGREYVPTLLKPLNLKPEMTLLDLSGGLGGTGYLVTDKYGAFTNAYEASAVLMEAGSQRAQMKGKASHVRFAHYDPEDLKLDRRYDAVFAKEIFFAINNKGPLLDTIEEHLKGGGKLLFTDYVAISDKVIGDLASWAAHEPGGACLWTAERWSAELQQRNLDIRVDEDITERQSAMIVHALERFRKVLETRRLADQTRAAVVDEVEVWARRLDAFGHGLRTYRFFCLKPDI